MSVFERLKTFFVRPNTIRGETLDPILAQNRKEARRALRSIKEDLHAAAVEGTITRRLKVVSSDRVDTGRVVKNPKPEEQSPSS